MVIFTLWFSMTFIIRLQTCIWAANKWLLSLCFWLFPESHIASDFHVGLILICDVKCSQVKQRFYVFWRQRSWYVLGALEEKGCFWEQRWAFWGASSPSGTGFSILCTQALAFTLTRFLGGQLYLLCPTEGRGSWKCCRCESSLFSNSLSLPEKAKSLISCF